MNVKLIQTISHCALLIFAHLHACVSSYDVMWIESRKQAKSVPIKAVSIMSYKSCYGKLFSLCDRVEACTCTRIIGNNVYAILQLIGKRIIVCLCFE